MEGEGRRWVRGEGEGEGRGGWDGFVRERKRGKGGGEVGMGRQWETSVGCCMLDRVTVRREPLQETISAAA